jgi:hypothetical protein
MPYDSGQDTDTDTDTEDEKGSDFSDSEDPRIRREEDPRYAIYQAAGPNFDTYDQQLKYMENPVGSEYNASTNITSLKGLTYLNAPKTSVTSLFCLKSSNRDRKVYPSPFYFSIKTPRVYKNVTKFQLVQISFPNNTGSVGNPSTFVSSLVTSLLELGVDPCCLAQCISATETSAGSNTIGLVEENRVNELGEPMMVTVSLPNGQYSNAKLAGELSDQANNTPPFNLITYDEFKDAFQTTRDISILFNEPGDMFYSNITQTKNGRCTKQDIMNCYYTQNHIDSFIEITDKIACNAYYYPVLKELLATHKAAPFLQTPGYSFDDVYDRVMNHFEGLDSDFYFDIIQRNREGLDNFRKHRTFRFKNINKYIWSYNEEKRHFCCINNQLHTSIQRDIQSYLVQCFDNEYIYNNISKFAYQSMKQEYFATNSIFKNLESNLSSVLAGYHFVSNYHYKGGDVHSTLESTFHVNSLHEDSTFTNMFHYTSVFGNQYHNLPGMKFTFSTFIDYHSTISSYYERVTDLNSTIYGIQEAAYTRHHQYVTKKYTGVLPDSMIQNRTYNNGQGIPYSFVGARPIYIPGESIFLQTVQSNQAASLATIPSNYSNAFDPTKDPFVIGASYAGTGEDPCSASTCSTSCAIAIKKLLATWYGCLPVNSEITSLTYRLGINELNLSHFQFSIRLLSTLSTGYDYFMQINEEQGFNNMDVAMDENYNITNETTGQVKLMSCKILTGGLGSGELAQTVIQNPIMFENYLGKLDKLTFKIFYNDNALTPVWQQIPFGDLAFNEWEATFQIEEAIGFADRNTGFGEKPTIPIPDNPNDMPYLGFTQPNNPNSK